MPVIDADAHVVESDRTWDFMDQSDMQFRPTLMGSAESGRQFWFIDGKIRGLARSVLSAKKLEDFSQATGRNVVTTQAARDMEDIEGRLQHMDELEIDIQVLHSTIFIQQIADRPEVEVAVCRAYNRWLADIWRQGKGRLRWSATLPFMAMEEALKELRTAVENGACAALMRPIEGDRLPTDPYFFPIYEEASRLNVPVVFHIGNANPENCDLVSQYNNGGSFWKFRLPTVGAFHSLLMAGIPDTFPKLRCGFVEASSQWVPYVISDLRRRFPGSGRTFPDNPLQKYRMYVTCQTDDDLEWVLKYAGEDNLVIGTDYGHTDQSSEIEAIRHLRENGDINPSAINKMLDDNPKALYNL
jgi:predicted TIM-barrel fold metal-dependent hydrolase